MQCHAACAGTHEQFFVIRVKTRPSESDGTRVDSLLTGRLAAGVLWYPRRFGHVLTVRTRGERLRNWRTYFNSGRKLEANPESSASLNRLRAAAIPSAIPKHGGLRTLSKGATSLAKYREGGARASIITAGRRLIRTSPCLCRSIELLRRPRVP